MKLPFPKWTLNTNAEVYSSEINDSGKPVKIPIFEGRANYVDKTRQVLNVNRELVLLSGVLIIPGNVLENLDSDTTLYVKINNLEKRVFKVNRPHNPDGSVFSTELLLE